MLVEHLDALFRQREGRSAFTRLVSPSVLRVPEPSLEGFPSAPTSTASGSMRDRTFRHNYSKTNAISFMQPQRLKGSPVISINQLIIVFHISRLSREIGRCLFIFFSSEIMTDTMNGIHMYYECETTTMNAMNGTNTMKRMSVHLFLSAFYIRPAIFGILCEHSPSLLPFSQISFVILQCRTNERLSKSLTTKLNHRQNNGSTSV